MVEGPKGPQRRAFAAKPASPRPLHSAVELAEASTGISKAGTRSSFTKAHHTILQIDAEHLLMMLTPLRLVRLNQKFVSAAHS